MKFNVEATLFSEKNMLFTLKDGEHHADRCIGHVRGDFGSNGNEFHHTWWPQHEELNTDEFKTELTQVVNELRSDSCGLLKSRKSMQSFCCDHARAKLLGHWNSETYGFKICTEKYMYYIKAFYGTGDYNFYINCFVRDRELEKRCDELDVLNGIFSAMKMDDIEVWFDGSNVLHAKDEDGTHWIGREVYRFITEECLCFKSETELVDGMYIKPELLERYIALSVANGVAPKKVNDTETETENNEND